MSVTTWRPPWTPQQTLKFTGILNDPDEPHQKLEFFVLAGTSAPVITGGWGQQQSISRPRRKAFTFTSGFPAATMDVPVRFEATVDYGGLGWTPPQIERNIQILEWMGGRGKLYRNGTHPAQGNTPIVQVSSFSAGGTATNLIPPNFHSEDPDDLRWLIANISYDQGAIRGPVGDRRRQDVTVSLVEYVAAPGAPASPRIRQNGRGTSTGYRSFKTTSAVNTIAKVCIGHGINSVTDWTTVVQFNHARLHVRSYNGRLRAGTTVQIPNSVFAR